MFLDRVDSVDGEIYCIHGWAVKNIQAIPKSGLTIAILKSGHTWARSEASGGYRFKSRGGWSHRNAKIWVLLHFMPLYPDFWAKCEIFCWGGGQALGGGGGYTPSYPPLCPCMWLQWLQSPTVVYSFFFWKVWGSGVVACSNIRP